MFHLPPVVQPSTDQMQYIKFTFRGALPIQILTPKCDYGDPTCRIKKYIVTDNFYRNELLIRTRFIFSIKKTTIFKCYFSVLITKIDIELKYQRKAFWLSSKQFDLILFHNYLLYIENVYSMNNLLKLETPIYQIIYRTIIYFFGKNTNIL